MCHGDIEVSILGDLPPIHVILTVYLPGVKPRVLQKLPRRHSVLGPPHEHALHKLEEHDLVPPRQNALGLFQAVTLRHRDVCDPGAYNDVSLAITLD